MMEELVSMIRAQSYDQMVFILFGGLTIVGAIVGTAFAMTRTSKYRPRS